MATRMGAARDLSFEIAFLTWALKAPSMREAVPRLAERAPRRGVTNSSPSRCSNVRSPRVKLITGARAGSAPRVCRGADPSEGFDFDHARGLRREQIAHLGTLDFVAARDNA